MLLIPFLKNIFWSELIQPSLSFPFQHSYFFIYSHTLLHKYPSAFVQAVLQLEWTTLLKTWMGKTKWVSACYAHIWDLNSYMCLDLIYSMSKTSEWYWQYTSWEVLFDHLKHYLTIWKIKKKTNQLFILACSTADLWFQEQHVFKRHVRVNDSPPPECYHVSLLKLSLLTSRAAFHCLLMAVRGKNQLRHSDTPWDTHVFSH